MLAIKSKLSADLLISCIFSAIIFLSIIGLINISAATAYKISNNGFFAHPYLFKQTVFVLLGILLCHLFSIISFKKIREYCNTYFLFFLILILALTIIPGVGIDVKGSSRWLNLYIIRLQPSEIIKIFFTLQMAHLMVFSKCNLKKFIGLALIPYFTICTLLLLQPDLGSTVIITLIFGLAMFITFDKISIKVILLVSFFVGVILVLLIVPSEYRMARVEAFLSPESNPLTKGYQLLQSFRAIANGGWEGTGWGNSLAVMKYLPEAHTDYIFAVIVEQFGIIIGVLLAVIMFIIPIFLILIFGKYKKTPASIFIIVFSSIIVLEIFINLGSVLGIIPPKGMALPFISYGGSGVVAHFIGFGLVFSAIHSIKKDEMNNIENELHGIRANELKLRPTR